MTKFIIFALSLPPGYSEDPTDNSEIPAGPGTGRSDVSPAPVLRHSPRQGPAQQVRVPGVVSTCLTTGKEAIIREMAERGEGMCL